MIVMIYIRNCLSAFLHVCQGLTLLHWASDRGLHQMAALLLENGANINATVIIVIKFSYKPGNKRSYPLVIYTCMLMGTFFCYRIYYGSYVAVF